MLSSLKASGKLGSARLVAVVKEVAPTNMAKDDEELGVGEFVSKYFTGGEVYLDKEQDLFKALGSRGMKMNTWNPFKVFSDISGMQKRMDAKGISGNLRGDSILLGGIMVVNKGGPVSWVSFEDGDTMSFGKPFNEDELLAALAAAEAADV
mmetsp:Transcript_8404/g.16416  ORF Transcript_8404/g.16416 Transcript_8404/m.16416 type:complete len:151 (+) Transcript_8404:400-852(+)